MKRSNNFMPSKYTRPSDYKVGFNDGYEKGLKKSNEIMAVDLAYIYGMLCLHFFNNEGWSTEKLNELVIQLQDEWVEESEYESILFSTKSDTVYECNIRPDLHSFQLSVTNTYNRKDLEPNVPSIEDRVKFFKQLKKDGFKVGIRIQPFIPYVTTTEIIDMFHDADHFTLEGLKIVPQNDEHKQLMLDITGLKKEDFTQMGLLNLRPEKRIEMYKPFIERFESDGLSYSIADNDMHHLGNNYCCCGDALIHRHTTFNNTTMCHIYGKDYCKEQVDEQIFNSGVRDCKCNQLFTSNRQEGCVSVQDFFDKRFYRKSSPFSPLFLIGE